MLKKALMVLSPFILLFAFGVALLLRPQYQAKIVSVGESFTRYEKPSPRATRRYPAKYAAVRVELDGEIYDVDVRDDVWFPLKPGDSVTVARDIWGNVVEYGTSNAYTLIAFSAFMGPVMLILLMCRSRRKKR